jgi:hypothetical protein
MAAGGESVLNSPGRRLPVDMKTPSRVSAISTVGSGETKERKDFTKGDSTARNERMYCQGGGRSDRSCGALTTADCAGFVATGRISGLTLILRHNLSEFGAYRPRTINRHGGAELFQLAA